MTILQQASRNSILPALALLMLATRFHHFGSVSFLPDASLAVFFLAGLYYGLGRNAWLIFAGLIALAGGIDYAAINYGGVSDWCVTPAYLFLLPTYALMFTGGALSRGFDILHLDGLLKTSGVLFISAALAFVVSNASFYLFSGRYAEMALLDYTQRVIGFALPYIGYALLYASLAFALQIVMLKSGLLDEQQRSATV